MNPSGPSNGPTLLVHAGAIADPAGFAVTPGSLLLDLRAATPVVLAAGAPAEVARHPAGAGAGIIALPGRVLLPGLVNAHTHLDLTHIGPRPFDPSRGFIGFVDVVRAERAAEDNAIAASVSHGIELLRAGGTSAVADIAGAPRGTPSLTPHRVLAESGLAGVSFIEFFAIGRGEAGGLERIRAALDQAQGGEVSVRLGLQPHATNTVSLAAFRWAVAEGARRGIPLSTHLAETPEEREFIGAARGPQRELLERLNVWSDEILRDIGHGGSPVAHLAPVLDLAPFLVAHVNDCRDEDLRLLHAARATVAYCPRASAYFGQERAFGPHRYREMLAAGIPVALGTDSIVNLPTHDRISVLDEMRFLHARDGADPGQLLRMGTLSGAAALGLDPSCFSLAPGGRPLGIIAIDVSEQTGWERQPLGAVMRSSAQPEWVWSRR